VDDPFVIQSGREIRSLDDWLTHAGPKKGADQWEHGRSAMESARAWLRTGRPAVPEELSALLEGREETAGFRPLYAIPELVTRLDEFRGEHRNHDLVVVGVARGGRTLLGIEAKADEAFGPPVGAYLRSTTTKVGSNLPERIRRLVRALFGSEALDRDGIAGSFGSLGYQLLTALAGTLIEARRRFAEQAVLLVHEFRSTSVPELRYFGTPQRALDRNAATWEQFVAALAASPTSEPNARIGPLRVAGSELISSKLPFFLGKATVHLGEEPARRRAAEQRALEAPGT
jgi:hypothetical protein